MVKLLPLAEIAGVFPKFIPVRVTAFKVRVPLVVLMIAEDNSSLLVLILIVEREREVPLLVAKTACPLIDTVVIDEMEAADPAETVMNVPETNWTSLKVFMVSVVEGFEEDLTSMPTTAPLTMRMVLSETP